MNKNIHAALVKVYPIHHHFRFNCVFDVLMVFPTGSSFRTNFHVVMKRLYYTIVIKYCREDKYLCSIVINSIINYLSIVTARIRRMGKAMFSVCPHLWGEGGGGQPGQEGGGQWGGQLGVGGVQPGGGVWGSAKIGQQNEYSLHGGRYASCVHAGGLSCFVLI